MPDKIKAHLADTTRFNIEDAISDWLFTKADKDPTVMIYFTAHGDIEEDRFGNEKDNLAKYLLLVDSRVGKLFATAVSNRKFQELLSSIKSKKLLFFMDSCYSGGVYDGRARDVNIIEDPYQKLAEGEGRLVIAASQSDQRSSEDQNLHHWYTHSLLIKIQEKEVKNGI